MFLDGVAAERFLERRAAARRVDDAEPSRRDFGRYGRIRVWGSIGFIAAVIGAGTARPFRDRGAGRWCSRCWSLIACAPFPAARERVPVPHDETANPDASCASPR